MEHYSRVLALALVSAVALGAPCAAQDAFADLERATSLVDQAEASHAGVAAAHEQLAEAVRLLDPLVSSTDRVSSEALLTMGRAQALLGNHAEASKWLTAFIASASAVTAASPSSAVAAGQMALARRYLVLAELSEGCEALARGHGRTAEKALIAAAELVPNDPVVRLKLAAARSDLFRCTAEDILSLSPPDRPPADLASLARREELMRRQYSRFGRLALGFWAEGDMGQANREIGRVIAARGAAAPLVAAALGLEAQLGLTTRSLDAVRAFYVCPVAPAELGVFTTRVASVGGLPVVVTRVYGPAVAARARALGRPFDAEQAEAFFASWELFTIGVVEEGLLTTAPADSVTASLVTGDGGAGTLPADVAIPPAVAEALGHGAREQVSIVVYPRPSPPAPLVLVLGYGIGRVRVVFEDPPAAPSSWLAHGPATAPAETLPPVAPPPVPSVPLTVSRIADECLPPLTRSAAVDGGSVTAVWMTRRFLTAISELSPAAPDAADLRALRDLSATHVVFMLRMATFADGPAVAEQAELRTSGGDRRFGAFVDIVARSPGLSRRSGAYGVCFPLTSKTGRVLELAEPGWLTLEVVLPDGRSVSFAWDLPVAEPAILDEALSGAGP